jgi:hypothetical protein
MQKHKYQQDTISPAKHACEVYAVHFSDLLSF